LLNYAKAYLPIVWNNPSYVKDHFEIFHLLGDPTLEVWRRVPCEVEIRGKYAYEPGGVRLYVELSRCPTGSTVTLWIDDTMIKRVEPQNTAFSLWFPVPVSNVPTPLDVRMCFKAPGCRFSETTVTLEN
jgi:hypothetical protein